MALAFTNAMAETVYYFSGSVAAGEGGAIYSQANPDLEEQGVVSLDGMVGKDFSYKGTDVSYGYMTEGAKTQMSSLWECYNQPACGEYYTQARMCFDDNGNLLATPCVRVYVQANPGYICSGMTAPSGYTAPTALTGDYFPIYANVASLGIMIEADDPYTLMGQCILGGCASTDMECMMACAMPKMNIFDLGNFTVNFAKSHVTGLRSTTVSTSEDSPTVLTSSSQEVVLVFDIENYTDANDFVVKGLPAGYKTKVDEIENTIEYTFNLSATGVDGSYNKTISIRGVAENDAQQQSITIYWSESGLTRNARLLPLHFENEDEFNWITVEKGSGLTYGGANQINYKGEGSNTWVVQFDGTPGELSFSTEPNTETNWWVKEGTTSSCSSTITQAGNISGDYTVSLQSSSRYVRISFSAGAANTITNFHITALSGFSVDKTILPMKLQVPAMQQVVEIEAADNSLLNVTCTDEDFACLLEKNVDGLHATLIVTNNATVPKNAMITISDGSNDVNIPVFSFIPATTLPVDFTTDPDQYLYYKMISGNAFSAWDASSRKLTFTASKGTSQRSSTFHFDGIADSIRFVYDQTKVNGSFSIQTSINTSEWNSANSSTRIVSGKTLVAAYIPADARYVRITYTNSNFTQTATIEQIQITAGVPQGSGKFKVGYNYFDKLEDALAYVNNHKEEKLVIVALDDYTLPAGNYTLPSNATLLIPYYDGQIEPTGKVPVSTTHYVTPTVYRTLTLANGVNLNVFGTIEVGAEDYCSQPEITAVSGPYGHIELNEGGLVTLNDGAILRAYGFVTGKGMVDVHYGADTYEFFQVTDWKGGGASAEIAGVLGCDDCLDKEVFIVNQYYFHNIEVPTIYRPGSHAWGELDVQVYGETHIVTDVMVIGLSTENTMFKMDEDKASDKNVWVRRTYDYQTDRQIYEINSSAYLGSMVISAMGFDFNSADYQLPITSNMKIHLLSGSMGITENTLLLPGAEIEVDKESTVTMEDGKNLYLFDANEWGRYVFAKNGWKYGSVVRYSPSWKGGNCPRLVNSQEAIGDAKINVHGTFRVDGNVFVTEGGANIFSTNEDAGSIYFTTEANDVNSEIWQVTGINPEITFESKTAIPMLLHNEDGSFAHTAGTEAGMSYCYFGNKWRLMTIDEDNDCFVHDNYGVYYAKPSGYVAINTSKDTKGEFVTNPDHTFSDANGDGRLFILMSNDMDCQWWEVEIKDNMYYCAKNNKYYYYSPDTERWEEQTFTVTWQNWDGSILKNADGEDAIYNVTYGTTPVYLGTNPTREESIDYTYDFIGWTPALNPVTENVVYTAQFEKKERKYTVIFQNENGGEIERHQYTRGEMPVCSNIPSKQDLEKSYTLIWEPAIGTVVKDQIYRATFQENPPAVYEVRFVNYNGDELQKGDVAVGTTPEYINADPTKPATDEYTYEFAGWSPELKPVDAAITYTAVFNEVPNTYAIKFFEEDGVTQIGETQNLAYGEIPTAPNYSKEATAEYTYTTVWNPTITAVTDLATYTGKFIETKNKYTVTVNAIGCVVEGAGAYDYGREVTLHITDVSVPGFSQDAKWKHTGNSEDITFNIGGNVTYIAEATPINNIVAEIGGEPVNITAPIEAASFTIKANTNASGQVNGAENIELVPAGKAYFEYDFNAQAMKWYAFAVPFVCDANTLRNATRTLTPGVDYDIMQYNGAIRANAGADRSAWEYISDKGINVLTPGHLYMILFAQAQSTVTFTKTASASINYTAPVTMNQYPAADELDANWNGVANPKLFYANLGTGVTYGQMYVGGEDRYDKVTLSSTTFPVGKPVFVQAATQSQVEVIPSASSAPLRRMLKADKQECEINLMQGNKECDNLSIIMNDDAENRYIIGEDLAKAGVSTKVAQMWINRYNAKLCVNSIAAENKVAIYPLGIFAPKAGAYTVVATSVPANTAVYLTEEDNIIADLTSMPYTLDLSKGTHNEFSLRMVGKTQPSVVTDFREAGINGKDVQKVIKDNTLYILRADKVFNAQGQLVK
ncbi:MAG: hypothetical protein KBS69_04040 [Bacteroidales bacterium]|nr:hypothetical protein [Candidatus Colicola caccequi]